MLLSPSDVMDPIWGDYGDGGRDDQRVSRRKMRIPQTMGRMTRNLAAL